MQRLVKTILLTVILLLTILSTACSYRGEPLPEDVLSRLDPEKITACQLTETNWDGTVFRAEETDPERVRAMYEALCHMKIKPVEREVYGGAVYTVLSFVQDGERIVVYSSLGDVDHTYITMSEDRAAIILNESELEEDYGWLTIMRSMLENGVTIYGGKPII